MSEPPVQRKKLAELIPDSRNGNDGTAYGNAMLEQSLQRNGAGRGILLDKHGRIIAGNKTHAKAGEIGLEEVIVVQTTGDQLVATQRMDLDLELDPKARELAWADNRVGEVNFNVNVAQLVEDAKKVDLSPYYSADAIDELIKKALEQTQDGEPDEVEDEPALSGDGTGNSRVTNGEIWQVGQQTLICGDCRIPEVWNELLRGKPVNLIVTSPPYAQQREYDTDSGFSPIHPDDYVDWFSAIAHLAKQNLCRDGSFMLNVKERVEDGQRLLWVKELVIAMVRRWNWHWREEFVWTHNGTPGKVQYNFKNQWEPIFQFTTQREIKIRPQNVTHQSDAVWQGGMARMSDVQGGLKSFPEEAPGEAYPGNVLSVGKNREALGHSAAFPVSLPEFFIKAYTDPEDRVLDPFCGSGSTLVAAQEQGRAGLGIEISPLYCELILSRLERLTGQQAERLS